MASVLDLVKHYQHAIEKYPQDEQKILKCIDKLYQLGVTVQHLQETGVGRTVNALRKEPGDVGQAARALVCKWKLMVASEESDQEGDHNNETSKYNGNGKDSDDSVNQSRSEYTRQETEPSYESSSKSNQNDYKHMNGNHGGTKRKYTSSEDEESNVKKSRHSSSSEEDFHRKTDVKIRRESSDSESDNQDTENSQSDSDVSDTSEEEAKIKIKSEPVDKHHKSSSSKHPSYDHVDHNRKSSTSKQTSDSSEKHSKQRSESKHSSESPSKERSHSSHKHKHSKEKEDSSEKRHKSDKESKQKEELSSPNKHKSNSEKHRSSSQKPDSGSEKHKSHSKSDKHGGRTDKHVSSSHKLETDKHKKPSEKETSSDKHKSKDNNSSLKEKHSSSKEKSKDRSSSKEKSKEKSSDRHNKGDKNHSLPKEKSKDSDKKSKHEKNNENGEKRSKTSSSSSHKSSSSNKSKEPKKKHVNSIEDGIDCGSGASFAEALGMIIPNKPKKKPSGIKETSSPSNTFSNDLSPAALLSPTAKLAPLPALEISALPEISPNYKPRPPPKLMPHFSDEDAISVVMSSKNQRTKVYSGNKVLGKIPTLYEMCVQILQEHIDALEFTGGVPYEILKPVVDKATPQQLFVLEHFNPYLMEDTDHLWQKFCEKHFRSKQRQELESWREMYIRCQEEQEHKLKSLTANIKIAQEAKKAPIKQTKMAYVDSVVKPPRNIARKQAQHGTAHAASASPAARVAALASSSNVLRGSARPSPSVPTTTIQKPKKAPLMQKALQFMRGRKR